MAVRLTNNAETKLSAAITATNTVIAVEDGYLLPFVENDDEHWFPLTLEDNQGNMEIVHVVGRSGNALTVQRGQEGTWARTFPINTPVSLRLTAGVIYELVDTLSALKFSMPVFPSGMIMAFARGTPPYGWIECDGRAVSRTGYADLFTAIGTYWGIGDGATTFNIPDLRGQFLRGWDHGRGLDADRTFASPQDSQNKAHNHGGFTSLNGNHTHSYTNTALVPPTYGPYVSTDGMMTAQMADETKTTSKTGMHQHQILSDGGEEARPRNVAILYAIKT